ncbi:MAG: hypothetical protein ACOYOK_14455, partial [Pseudobdellovibrionaceae bacterium]
RPARKWYHFLVNPKGNLYLFHISSVERFLMEVKDLDPQSLDERSVNKLQSYQQLKKIVLNHLLKKHPKMGNEDSCFQIKIALKSFDMGEEEIFISSSERLYATKP